MQEPTTGAVAAVSTSASHGFSKMVSESINLIKDHGVEGDAHAGAFVKHRYLARWRPRMRNERQVHLIDDSLFATLQSEGFRVRPGDLGENITTHNLDMLRLPLGKTLALGSSAILGLRGLRTPCILVDRFQRGLLKTLVRKGQTPRFRAGVMAIVLEGGVVRAGDPIAVTLPLLPWNVLPAL